MLILTRRIGESIIIGDDITVTVLGTQRGHIKIGIEAPKNISVHREEVYQRIAQEKQTNDMSASIKLGLKTPLSECSDELEW